MGVLILLLAYWQARYMRLRFLGRVSLESTLEEHEEEAGACSYSVNTVRASCVQVW